LEFILLTNFLHSQADTLCGLEDFHFHTLRHAFTSDLLSYGAVPKEVQKLLGHSTVSTAMNICAHASTEAKRSSAKLLDIQWESIKQSFP